MSKVIHTKQMNKPDTVQLIKEYTDRTNGLERTLSITADYNPEKDTATITKVTASVRNYENRNGFITGTSPVVKIDLTEFFESHLPQSLDVMEQPAGDINWEAEYNEYMANQDFTCNHCGGTGEGMWEGSNCSTCKGRGCTMDNQHTPGPWMVNPGTCHKINGDYTIAIDAPAEGRDYVAYLRLSSIAAIDNETTQANAHLIAAAPNMIREMERYLPLIEWLESHPEAWQSATEGTGIATGNGYRAAILKAKGGNP